MHTKNKLLSIFIVQALVAPSVALSQSFVMPGEPFTQDFVITAYYSPTPDQCCYVKGNYEADVVLNGRGTNGADGTAVYPGMLAAPPSYAFGTRVVLPGIGTMTVHDRGGAIQEQGKVHRLDVWAGVGEEGLARALAFGVVRIKGTVYPKGTEQPAENIDLTRLPAPLDILRPFIVQKDTFTTARPAAGETGLSIRLLQEELNAIGYLTAQPTGHFGPATREALKKLRADFSLPDEGDKMTDEDIAFINALKERKDARDPVAAVVERGSRGADIAQAKRTLRFLGYFKGRTNGEYDDALAEAIMNFQKDHKLIGDATSPGAGRIGPKTRAALIGVWKSVVVKNQAAKILTRLQVERLVAERGQLVSHFLGKGDKGAEVKTLQSMLLKMGLLRGDQITGLFGAATEAAVLAFQQSAGVIQTASDKGAGYVGPATLHQLREHTVNRLVRLVREQGWEAI